MVFPASAGVIPGNTATVKCICGFPRIRGGDPDRYLSLQFMQ